MLAELGLTYIDIVGLICILLFFMIGYSRGFLREILKFGSWFISLIGAKILAYPLEGKVYEFLNINEKLDIKLKEIVSTVDFTNLDTVRVSLDVGLNRIPFIGKLLDNDLIYGNWNLTNTIQKSSVSIQSELVSSLHEGIEPIIHNFLHIVVFVAVFLILMIITGILFGFVRKALTSVRIMGGTDKLLGGLLGLIKGGMFFIIFYFVLFVVLSLIGSDYLSVLMSSRFYEIFIGIGDIVPK